MAASLGHGESATAIDYCQRYPGDARVDPGIRVDVSPIVATRPAALPHAKLTKLANARHR
ncbi:MAG: hypothetical protein M3Y17_07580 [Actinomycetota bacterium]|nr:hypothetical protein [Actinomycetota bacterium]